MAGFKGRRLAIDLGTMLVNPLERVGIAKNRRVARKAAVPPDLPPVT